MLREVTPETIEKDLQLGHLVDLSEFASGSSKRVVATASLWRSLLWTYPTAQTSDLIDPSRLLSDLGLTLANPFDTSAEPTMLFPYVPSHKPTWLPKDFAIVVYQQPFATLLKLPSDGFPNSSFKLPVLPAGIVIKLIRLLTRLKQVARSHDRPVVRTMTTTIETIRSRHPLHQELLKAGPTHSPTFPKDLKQDEFRRLLISDLTNLLEVALACGLSPETGAQLATSIDKLRSPLYELLHVVRSLILLAAAVPAPSNHLSPIDDLLTAYQSLSKLLDQEHPSIRPEFLEMLDTDAFVLSQILPPIYAEEFAQMRQTLAILQSLSCTFAVGTTYPPQYHIYH